MAEKTPSRQTTASRSTDANAAGGDEVKRAIDEAAEKGFFGREVDQTPNEAYTLQGGPAGEGTPEGDRMQGKDRKGN